MSRQSGCENSEFYGVGGDGKYGFLFARYPDGKTPFGNVKKVILTVNVMWCGWEMDDKACFVELEDGSKKALTSSHGGLYVMSREEAIDKINETETNLNALKQMLALMDENDEKSKDI